MTSYLDGCCGRGPPTRLADAVSAAFALALLPVYTRALTRARLRHRRADADRRSSWSRSSCGWAWGRRSCATTTCDADPAERDRVARTATAWIFVATTARRAARSAPSREPLSQLAARVPTTPRDARRRARAVGVHEPRARLRAPARGGARPPVPDRLADQRALTVGLTVVLVVVRDQGALGLLLGNYGAPPWCCSACGSCSRGRPRACRRPRAMLGPMLRFGLPTVPAEVSVFLLNVIDRFWLYRIGTRGRSAGLYSLAVKLAAIVVFTVRAFQYAWPPLAYSIKDDQEAAPRLRPHHDLLRALHRADRRRHGPARPLDRADVRGARVLRRPRGPALGRAGLGALRPVPRARRHGRPGEGHDAQLPGRGARAGGQRRAARRCSSTRSASPAPASRCAAPTW